MASFQSTERHTISTALGIAPGDTSIAQLSLMLNGLSTISARGNSITIPIPPHLARSDITVVFDHLPQIELGGDATKVLARRSAELAAEPLKALTVPPRESHRPRQDTSRVSSQRENPLGKVRAQPASTVGRLGLTRASQVVDALGVSTGDIPDYPTVVQKLGDALTCEHRPSKNSRTDGVLYITVQSQGDASSLLEGLGFNRTGSSGGSVWGGLRYQKVCQQTETKSSASLALTPSGCDITIGLGEPWTESFSATPYSFPRPVTPPEE